ncbi:iron chelate uptake ABC transporter family permease subunit [Actinomyces minihominis]|uniref:iron chelate uptake ABC transporter family permease subunit n=1 Tax=Actinomyces minihominis TaxID=2002838 RepID=UPI001F5DDA8F|nr:iron chelate uptake ABC transporter family permease subunit [Actinomyces minihominis]
MPTSAPIRAASGVNLHVPMRPVTLGHDTVATARQQSRAVGAFVSASHRARYGLILGGLIIASVVVCFLILTWGNSFTPFTDKWWRVTSMRVSAVVVILTVTFAQAVATVTFQTVTNNRLITPSIMGFESLFVLVQTGIVYFMGASSLVGLSSTTQFLIQSTVMVGFAVLLYSWLLSGRLGNLHIMLLVGIVIGTGLGALSTFMQRMLDPNEFDVLRARLFANIGSAETELLPLALPICLIAGGGVWLLGRRLNVLALGPEVSANLGLNHRRQTMLMLTLVAVLMAVSTSLVGPMTFLGFLVATLAYLVTDTHDHRRILPVAWLVGIVVLGAAYLMLKHVFPMVDAVMIIVELVGGVVFLGFLMKRGRL